jgi:hypothetical protein
MERTQDFGSLIPVLLCFAGMCLVFQRSYEWYTETVIVAGATISATGLVTLYWAATRYLSHKMGGT